MRQAFLAVVMLFAFTLAPTAASAQTPTLPEPAAPSANPPVKKSVFSMGLILGDPTGLTMRVGIGNRNAIQIQLGYSPFPGDGVAAMVDWTYDAWNFLRNNRTAALLFYFGFGAKAEWFAGRLYAYEYNNKHSFPDQSHFGLGARALVGLRASFIKAPFDVFFELAPLGFIVVVPDPAVYYDFDVAFGFRYRF